MGHWILGTVPIRTARWLLAVALLLLMLVIGGATAWADEIEQTEPLPPTTEVLDDQPGDVPLMDQIETMTPFETWELLAGLLASGFIIPVVTRRVMDHETKKLIALGFAAVIAIVGSAMKGELDNVVFTATTVMKMALTVYVSYETIWKARFLSAIPRTIEEKTTRGPWVSQGRLDG